jgi:hypothetical protein
VAQLDKQLLSEMIDRNHQRPPFRIRTGAKRPPGNIQRPAGLKIACFRKWPRLPRSYETCIGERTGRIKISVPSKEQTSCCSEDTGNRLFVPLPLSPGREDFADSRIGNMLSASPMGADGNWPAEPVRKMIDLFRSKPMIEGFEIGKDNHRGVTTRGPRDGGELERQEAAKFRAWAKAINHAYPHTAKALDRLADRYEWEAKRHDEDAERLDWEV